MPFLKMTPGRDCPEGEAVSMFTQLADAQQRADTRKMQRAADQQDRRAARMGRKWLRGNRRAAKATMRATALHEHAAARTNPQP